MINTESYVNQISRVCTSYFRIHGRQVRLTSGNPKTLTVLSISVVLNQTLRHVDDETT